MRPINKGTTDLGRLTPVFCERVLPSDDLKVSLEAQVRMAPLDAPIMEQLNCDFHAFFVPERLLWEDFEEFITTGANGNVQPVKPTGRIILDSSNVSSYLGPSSLVDYLDFPTYPSNTSILPGSPDFTYDATPFLAYQMIWQEYFRDENLQEEIFQFPYPSGTISFGNAKILSLRYRCWSKDYFTSALTSAQLGEDVGVPIAGGNAPVVLVNTVNTPRWQTQSGTTKAGDLQSSATGSTLISPSSGESLNNVQFNPNGTLQANLAGASAVSVNNLRLAIAVQQWRERMITGGTRYKEQLYSMFGVISPDARLQRPEYLGKLNMKLQIGEVFQTSQTTDSSPQGEMSGRSNTYGNGFLFKKYNFKEHGFVFILMSIKPRATYQQGLPRKWQKFDWDDYAWPLLSNLGEQEVKNSELYFDFGPSGQVANDDTFGYQSRYSEYKFLNSTVHGDFKTSLSFWHLGRIFNSRPGLNEDFITVKPADANRIFPVYTGSDNFKDRFWYQILFDVRWNRPLPKFARPGGFTV
ncbi:major capsid protein [Sigmofec virus UA08Rod_6581]|uniref:Major capsid protein n=1 Tax=Sigmofec virus UA08Rod_6581 TaxID=2929235 RepID=A0A976N0J8_9VIRU|nr:major capsid protein [Sigmofec virus UA08Rod_6581]